MIPRILLVSVAVLSGLSCGMVVFMMVREIVEEWLKGS